MINDGSRLGYIDAAKGLLIIMVVVGHITNFNTPVTAFVKTWFYTFHIPAFFIISGLLVDLEKWRKQSFYIFVRKKFYSLLVPYIFFEISAGLLQLMLFGIDKVNPLGIFYGIITLHCRQGADWFLPTLFLAELLLWVIIRLHSRILCFLIITVFLLFSFIAPEMGYVVAVLKRVFIASVFLIFGAYFKKILLHLNRTALIACMIGTLILTFLNGTVDLSIRQFNNPFLYLTSSVLGTYFILHFAKYTDNSLLEDIGKNSLIIMGTHQSVMVIFNVIYGTSTYDLSMQGTILLATAIFELITIPFINKYIPFFAGKV